METVNNSKIYLDFTLAFFPSTDKRNSLVIFYMKITFLIRRRDSIIYCMQNYYHVWQLAISRNRFIYTVLATTPNFNVTLN